MSEEYIYWIWLSLAGGCANPDYGLLLSHFKNARAVYEADSAKYRDVEGLKIATARKLADKDLKQARDIFEFCKSHSVRLLHCMESDYPIKLKWIYAYPVLLYVCGTLPNLNELLTVAVVGTRNYTEYGKLSTYKLAGGLARCNSVVISGLAYGIDSVAHAAAVDNRGKTIAVMGTGIDRIYPSSHRELAKRVMANGALVTEYPPGSPPSGFHFPQRNRIISGLSDAVVVTEAPKGSGALITARLATEQSRTIFVVPGNTTSPNSYGAISLLKDGVKPVVTALDIVEEYERQYSYLAPLIQSTDFDVQMPKDLECDPTQAQVSKSGIFKNFLPNFEKNATKPPKTGIKSEKSEQKYKKAEVTQTKSEPEPKPRTESTLPLMNAAETEIYERIVSSKKASVDELITDKISAGELMTTLTKLELSGVIKGLPGGYYIPNEDMKG